MLFTRFVLLVFSMNLPQRQAEARNVISHLGDFPYHSHSTSNLQRVQPSILKFLQHLKVLQGVEGFTEVHLLAFLGSTFSEQGWPKACP